MNSFPSKINYPPERDATIMVTIWLPEQIYIYKKCTEIKIYDKPYGRRFKIVH